MVFGEVVLFLWPQLPMLWLGIDSILGFATMLLIGVFAILFLGWWLDRRLPRWSAASRFPSIAIGLGIALVSVSALFVLAWCLALGLGKATAA